MMLKSTPTAIFFWVDPVDSHSGMLLFSWTSLLKTFCMLSLAQGVRLRWRLDPQGRGTEPYAPLSNPVTSVAPQR